MMTLGDWAVVVAVLAALWALQIYMAYLQAQAFMAEVRRLRGMGRTAVGVSSTSRLRPRTYVALAEHDRRVVDAVQISGLTVFARPQAAGDLHGRRLDDLVGDDGNNRARAASMAAASLLAPAEHAGPAPELDDDERAEEVSASG